LKVNKLSAVLFTIGLLLAACTNTEQTLTSPEESAPVETQVEISIVASFYPLAYVAEQVVQDLANVTTIAAASAEPHDFELSPTDVAKIVSSDLAIHIPDFMPSFDAALADLSSEKIIDATNGITLLEASHEGDGHKDDDEHGHEEDDEHGHEGDDPHIWLSPLNMILLADQIANRVSESYPDLTIAINLNLENFKAEMLTLDSKYKNALASCEIKTLLVSHEAFGYLVNQYGFEQLGISGISPEAEPSPMRLAEVAKEATKIKATTIYYETKVDPSVANVLAAEIGITTAVLDPIETKPEMGDYLYAMEQNLEALVQGQGCKS
jgi:zinc transport system substrate-binding protein